MKIGILGTRGIPNYYGGFEQFAESLAVYLMENGHEVTVYNSSNHPYRDDKFKGVNIVHCKDPENTIGSVGQFIYDLNCILNSRTKDFDIILQLGYTSNSIWSFLLPKNPIIITNMDGMEWKRKKYSSLTKLFLKFAEKLAIKSSDYLIADSLVIQNYLQDKYNETLKYIAYGSDLVHDPDASILEIYNVRKYQYNMLISRFEPENNIEMILDGFVNSEIEKQFLVIGNYDHNRYGQLLRSKYIKNKNIIFLGGVFDKAHLNSLRFFSELYFHGHSVGGTNPSLIDAMASNALIIAHDNEFNRLILSQDGFYFKNVEDVENLLKNIKKHEFSSKINSNLDKIKTYYNTENINYEYLNFFNECSKEN